MEPPRTSTDLAKGNESLPLPPKNEPQSNSLDTERKGRLDSVLQSDIGLNTLLNRLKQSISSTREYSSFLKKRATVEEEHAQGLKRLSRSTHELIRRPENRQGSYAQSYEEITRIHDRMAEHGLQFASLLHQMSNDLTELAGTIERGRKQWKTDGVAAEKKVQDSESALDKAKSRYDSLAEQYDRARTGDRQSGRFGIKTKSAAQQEEDLHRKVQTADSDYFMRVQTAQKDRQELTSTHRPQAVKALQDLITECDSALSMHLAKYAQANERLLLNNGLCVSPLKSQTTNGPVPGPRSLREIAQSVNNDKDLDDYVLGFSNKAGTKPPEIKYEKHPALASPKQSQPPQFPPNQSYNAPQPSFGAPGGAGTGSFGRTGTGPQPTPSGQMSGVTPYQQSHQRDGSFQGPPGQYGVPPGQTPQQRQGTGNVPQIPPLSSMSGGLGSNPAQPSVISPMGPNNEYRAVVSPMNQGSQLHPTASRPDNIHSPVSATSPSYGNFSQPDGPGNSSFRGPQQAGPSSNVRQDSMPGPMNNRQGNGGPPYGPSSSYGPQGQSNFGRDSRGPQGPSPQGQSSFGPGNRGPSGTSAGTFAGAAAGVGAAAAAAGVLSNTNGNHQPTPSTASSQATTTTPAGPQGRRSEMHRPNLPPNNPVFGVSLDDLFRRDNSAVPMIVYQCVQAVDLFGLDVEGIYRTSGSAPHIMEMKAMFDNG